MVNASTATTSKTNPLTSSTTNILLASAKTTAPKATVLSESKKQENASTSQPSSFLQRHRLPLTIIALIATGIFSYYLGVVNSATTLNCDQTSLQARVTALSECKDLLNEFGSKIPSTIKTLDLTFLYEGLKILEKAQKEQFTEFKELSNAYYAILAQKLNNLTLLDAPQVF